MEPLEVVYEDNHVIVVVKPQNVPSQPDASGDESVLDMVRESIRVRHSKPGQAFAGLVHRLDRPAGGLMVFARTSKGASRLSRQMRDGGFEKTYLAVVAGAAEERGVLEDWLVKDGQRNVSRVAEPDEEGARRARLSYEALGRSEELSLLRIRLDTGRAHQIRVQMSAAGHPLAGDMKYGGPKAPRLCLWASQLAFEHPTRHERLEFACAPPDIWPWILFREETEPLRSV